MKNAEPCEWCADPKKEGHVCDPNDLIYEIDKLRKSAAVFRERVGRALVSAVDDLSRVSLALEDLEEQDEP